MADGSPIEKLVSEGTWQRSVPGELEDESVASGIQPSLLEAHYKGEPTHEREEHGGDASYGDRHPEGR